MDMAALKIEFPSMHPNKFYHHLTIAFRPESLSKPNSLGAVKELKIIGRLITDKVDALLVDLPELQKPFPHITLSTAEGIKPAEVNTEFEKHFDSIHYFVPLKEPSRILTVYGYFDGKEKVLK